MFWLFVFNPLFLTCVAVMASSVPFFFPVLWSSLADTLSPTPVGLFSDFQFPTCYTMRK